MKGWTRWMAWVAVMAVTALGGCAWLRPAPTPQGWTEWVCDTQAQVQWRYADAERRAVDARLKPEPQLHHLKSEAGTNGQLYSDGVLALHVQGKTGLVYWVATNDLIGRGCKAP
jgi:membrane-bound inhibitor of C-type lysozyme